MSCGSKILIFYAVEFFAALNNTCISDRTIALLFLDVPSRKFFGFPYNYKTNAPLVQSIRTNKANVPADLQSAGIKYKDFNPLTSYFYFRYEFLIKKIAIKV